MKNQFFVGSEWLERNMQEQEPSVWEAIFTAWDVGEGKQVALKVGMDLEKNIWILDYIMLDENDGNEPL